jgi:hypothetical protein
MAIVEDEYVTGAGYAAVSDQVASSSQTAMLPGADDRRGPARARMARQYDFKLTGLLGRRRSTSHRSRTSYSGLAAINRALADRGEERASGSFVPHGEEAQTPITGGSS